VAPEKGATQALVLATVAFSLSFAIWGLISALVPRFRDIYRLSPVEASVLIAIPVLLGSLGRIPMGVLADRFGGRIVFSLLLIFCGAASMGASLSRSYTTLLTWALLIGCAGTSFAVGVAFVSKWFDAKHQGVVLGIYGVGNIGQSIAMYAAPALAVASGDWRLPFWTFGTAAAVFGLFFLLYAHNAPAKAHPKRIAESLVIFWHEPLAWVLSLFYFLTFGGFVALSIYLPTLLGDIFRLSLTDAGARVAGFVVIATLMRPLGGWLSDRYGGARVLAVVFPLAALTALGLVSTGMVIFTAGALGTAALLGTGNGAVFKLVPDCFPRETGTVTGLVGAAGGLGGFFPPLLLGVIRNSTGGYSLGFVWLSCFALICLAADYFAFLRDRAGVTSTDGS